MSMFGVLDNVMEDVGRGWVKSFGEGSVRERAFQQRAAHRAEARARGQAKVQNLRDAATSRDRRRIGEERINRAKGVIGGIESNAQVQSAVTSVANASTSGVSKLGFGRAPMWGAGIGSAWGGISAYNNDESVVSGMVWGGIKGAAVGGAIGGLRTGAPIDRMIASNKYVGGRYTAGRQAISKQVTAIERAGAEANAARSNVTKKK